MPFEPRWGATALDHTAHDLPALTLSFLPRHAPAQGKLLELGSGEGKVLRTLARERPALTLVGCDVRDVRDVPPADAGSAYAFYRALLGQILYRHTKEHAHSFTRLSALGWAPSVGLPEAIVETLQFLEASPYCGARD
jgi:hypothetical protein